MSINQPGFVMSSTALYTDLSRYYDLMCAEIDYREQTEWVCRIQRLFGNGGKRCLDIGCGTGPHVRHFLDAGFSCSGMDIHPPMLDIARQRCPGAMFFQGDMAAFTVAEPVDLATCFLYSIHYNQTLARLQQCLAAVHAAQAPGGVFVFNAVDKTTIDNTDGVRQAVQHEGSELVFRSGWSYPGQGERQELLVRIDKTTDGKTETWQDRHAMVAVSFKQLQEMLAPLFEVQVFEHDYSRITPWDGRSGNALLVCIRQ